MNKDVANSEIHMGLKARREKCLSLYKEGFYIADIARYFEVTISSIMQSFNVIGYVVDERKIVEKLPESKRKFEKRRIDYLLEERDKNIAKLSDEEVFRIGFWKRPAEYKNAHKIQNNEIALQTELCAIGFRKKAICKYMRYNDSTSVVVTKKPKESDNILKERMQLVSLFYKDASAENKVTCKEIVEYCGISVQNIYAKPKAETIASKKRKKYLEEITRDVYSLYVEKGMTQQEIAEKLGICRKSVMTYLDMYRKANNIPEDKGIPAKLGPRKKNISSSQIKDLASKFLIKEEDGKYVKKNTISYAFIAKEMGLTEVTVVKYINLINEKGFDNLVNEKMAKELASSSDSKSKKLTKSTKTEAKSSQNVDQTLQKDLFITENMNIEKLDSKKELATKDSNAIIKKAKKKFETPSINNGSNVKK